MTPSPLPHINDTVALIAEMPDGTTQRVLIWADPGESIEEAIVIVTETAARISRFMFGAEKARYYDAVATGRIAQISTGPL